MTSLEDDLRTDLARVAARAPSLPGMAGTALARGRRVRRRRRAAGAALAVVAMAGGAGLVAGFDRPTVEPTVAAARLQGPPRVATFTTQQSGLLTFRVGEREVVQPLAAGPPLAQVGADVLLVDDAAQLVLLSADGQRRVVARGLASTAAAVSADGRRAAMVVEGVGQDAGGTVLQEVAVPDGRVLRRTVVAPELTGAGTIVPTGYAGQSVLLRRDGPDSLLWGPGEPTVQEVSDVVWLAGSAATADDPQGRVVLRREGARCSEVRALPLGTGATWELCRELAADFSPDGRLLLATNAVGDGLVVRDAADGHMLRELEVPEGLRAYGWESDGATLHTTVDGDRTVVVRCVVRTGRCAEAASFPGTGTIPQPVTPTG